MNKIIYIDMDDTLCDFMKRHKEDLEKDPTQIYPQSNYEFWFELEPIENAIESVLKLKEKYDVFILSMPSKYNLHSFTGKAYWVKKHLGIDMLDNLILTRHKTLLSGNYLIDDRTHLYKEFKGELITFGSEEFPNWLSITNRLL